MGEYSQKINDTVNSLSNFWDTSKKAKDKIKGWGKKFHIGSEAGALGAASRMTERIRSSKFGGEIRKGAKWMTTGLWSADAKAARAAARQRTKDVAFSGKPVTFSAKPKQSVWTFAAKGLKGIQRGLSGAVTGVAAAGKGFLKSSLSVLKFGLAFATTPLGLIAILVTAAILVWKNWDRLSGALKKGFAWLQGILAKTKTWFLVLIAAPLPFIAIPALIIKHWGKIKEFFASLIDGIKKLWDKFANSAIGKFLGFGKDAEKGGENIGKGVATGIKKKKDTGKAVAGVVGEVRDHLPHSPAKKGPLKDLHKVRLVETIAESLKGGPLTNKLGGVMSKARAALAKSPLALPARALGAVAGAALSVLPAAAANKGVRAPVQITINIDARGAARGAKAVLALVPKIEKAIAAAQDRRDRASNGGVK